MRLSIKESRNAVAEIAALRTENARLAADNERLMLAAVCAATPTLPQIKGYCRDCGHWREPMPGVLTARKCRDLALWTNGDFYCSHFRMRIETEGDKEAPDER